MMMVGSFIGDQVVVIYCLILLVQTTKFDWLHLCSYLIVKWPSKLASIHMHGVVFD